MDKTPVYLENAQVVAESGAVKVYRSNGELYMENKPGNLISYEDKKKDYIWQLNQRPFGKVLILGLGLGISAKYIFSLRSVKELVILEEDLNVIEAAKVVQPQLDLYKIIKVSSYLEELYEKNSTYNFIFLDCYSKVNENSLPIIADLVNACKKNLSLRRNDLLGWLPEDTPEPLVDIFFDLFNLK